MDEFFAPAPRRGRAHHEFKPLEFYFPSGREPIEPTEIIPQLQKNFLTRELSFVSPHGITILKQNLKNFLCEQSIDVEDHTHWFSCKKLVNEERLAFNINFYATHDNKHLCIIRQMFGRGGSFHQITEELKKVLVVSFHQITEELKKVLVVSFIHEFLAF